MKKAEIEHFYPKTRQHWRQWLEKNHLKKEAVWMIRYRQHTGKPTLSWSDAVDEALCFGWIDSKSVSIDEHSFKQYYCRRKPNSTWSKVNKEKIKQLTEAGKMTDEGLRCIAVAKKNGSWIILDDVEERIIPADLALALGTALTEKFRSLSRTAQKAHLHTLAMAKTAGTRNKRISGIVEKLNG